MRTVRLWELHSKWRTIITTHPILSIRVSLSEWTCRIELSIYCWFKNPYYRTVLLDEITSEYIPRSILSKRL